MTKLDIVAPPGTPQIVITRVFDAPRALVFKAFTDPDLIARWWGPAKSATTVDKMEVKRGGIWEGLPGHVLLETVIFEEHDGKTTVTDTSVFQTVEDRDGMVASGMESGAAESMNRLEELIKTMS